MLSTLIPNVEEIATQIWATKLSEDDLLQLGSPTLTGGERSVVILTTAPEFIDSRAELRVVNGSALVAIAASRSEATLIISAPISGLDAEEHPTPEDRAKHWMVGEPTVSGDAVFLNSLASYPTGLAQMASEVLAGVREFSPNGHLVLAPVSKRWTERPEQFLDD